MAARLKLSGVVLPDGERRDLWVVLFIGKAQRPMSLGRAVNKLTQRILRKRMVVASR